jgi:hypothetical protein
MSKIIWDNSRCPITGTTKSDIVKYKIVKSDPVPNMYELFIYSRPKDNMEYHISNILINFRGIIEAKREAEENYQEFLDKCKMVIEREEND